MHLHGRRGAVQVPIHVHQIATQGGHLGGVGGRGQVPDDHHLGAVPVHGGVRHRYHKLGGPLEDGELPDETPGDQVHHLAVDEHAVDGGVVHVAGDVDAALPYVDLGFLGLDYLQAGRCPVHVERSDALGRVARRVGGRHAYDVVHLLQVHPLPEGPVDPLCDALHVDPSGVGPKVVLGAGDGEVRGDGVPDEGDLFHDRVACPVHHGKVEGVHSLGEVQGHREGAVPGHDDGNAVHRHARVDLGAAGDDRGRSVDQMIVRVQLDEGDLGVHQEGDGDRLTHVTHPGGGHEGEGVLAIRQLGQGQVPVAGGPAGEGSEVPTVKGVLQHVQAASQLVVTTLGKDGVRSETRIGLGSVDGDGRKVIVHQLDYGRGVRPEVETVAPEAVTIQVEGGVEIEGGPPVSSGHLPTSYVLGQKVAQVVPGHLVLGDVLKYQEALADRTAVLPLGAPYLQVDVGLYPAVRVLHAPAAPGMVGVDYGDGGGVAGHEALQAAPDAG